MADIEKNNIENTETPAPADKAEAKAAKAEKTKKSNKESLGKRIAGWFRSCKAEMKKIVWLDPKSVLRNSVMVIITIVVVAAVIALLDYIFSAGIVGLNKII